MRKILSSYVFSLALAFLLVPTAFAETQSENNDYRIPLYDKIDFKAEQSGANKVSMSWSAFKGHNDETFEYYKVIRSQGNSNPLYPEDGAISVKSKVGDLRHADGNAWKSAYYRVCAITNKKGRYCSNVVWVEIEKKATTSDSKNDCDNYAHDGSCEEDEHKPTCKNYAYDGSCEEDEQTHDKREQQREQWSKNQDEAKARLAEKKEKMEAEREAKQKEWEAKKEEAKEKKKEQVKEREAKKAEMTEDRAQQQEALYEKLYTRLDGWLENFGEKLEQSDISSTKKVERIEMIQARFATWKEGKSVRIKMVEYLNETLNEWKEKYSAGDDFEEIDAFLEGLLD